MCPAFLHYHVCKHCLAYGLAKKEVTVPKRVSLQTAGMNRGCEAAAAISISLRT